MRRISDASIKLIPTTPSYVSSDEAAERARSELEALFPDADYVAATTTSEINFTDPGENLEGVACPHCQTVLDIGWAMDAINAAYEHRFERLEVGVPSCGATVSLNDLQRNWPAGFARFVLRAENPGDDIEDDGVRRIGELVGSPLRKILAY